MSLFLVFEGLDGSGSTTQAQLLANKLNAQEIKAVHASEPTEEPIGKLIRSALQHEWETSAEALQLLFTADRAHHLKTYIHPNIAEGTVVICDRYIWSTIAYGSLACDMQWLRDINSTFRQPDFTFFLDVSPDTCLERIIKRGEQKEFFEKKEKLENIYATFQKLLAESDTAAILDGEESPKEISERVMDILSQKFPESFSK